MYKRSGTWAALLMVLALVFAPMGLAEGNVVQAYLTLRKTMITQDSVLNIGEDLSMEATVEGVVPAVYQWYFNNEPIAGANHRVYNIVNAQLADAGTYRMDAFDESGKMLLSVDVAVRVIDPNAVPESGDSSLPLSTACALLAGAVALLGIAAVAKRRCAA